MFAKPANAAPGAPDGARKPAAASFIAQDLTLTGELVSDGEAHLDGRLKGDARVHRLVVGETGSVEGAIEADSVEIRGRVLGTIRARSVRLHPSAEVEGDITHQELAIEAGARFNGRAIRAEAAQPPLQVAAE